MVKHIAIIIILNASSISANYQVYKINETNVIANVDKITITTDEFINSYEFGPAFVKKQPDSKLKHLNFMINEKLLATYGENLGLDTTEQVLEMLAAFENDLATEAMFKEEIFPQVKYSKEEIDSVLVQKTLELEIKWIYCKTDIETAEILSLLKQGISFDSLFLAQINDTTFLDMRSMNTNRYDLGKKNPLLATLIDTLSVGHYSSPIKTSEGWYIVKLSNAIQKLIVTESENKRFREESIAAVKKKKMDFLSDKYLEQEYNEQTPKINKEAFNIALAHTANFELTGDLYKEWKIFDLLKSTIDELGIDKDNVGNLVLVELQGGSIILKDFIIWYRTRIQNIKFDKTSLNKYGLSLFSVVQRMIRDKILIDKAYSKKYHNYDSVKKEMQWWKSKIIFSAVRNELINSIIVNNDEVNISSENDSISSEELIKREFAIKLYRLLKDLREKSKIKINMELLSKLQVTSENDPQAIELYSVKTGGLVPRNPYPTIDNDWQYWQ